MYGNVTWFVSDTHFKQNVYDGVYTKFLKDEEEEKERVRVEKEKERVRIEKEKERFIRFEKERERLRRVETDSKRLIRLEIEKQLRVGEENSVKAPIGKCSMTLNCVYYF